MSGPIADRDHQSASREDDVLGQAVAVVRNAASRDEYAAVWPLLRQASQDGEAAVRRGTALLQDDDPDVRATGCDLLGWPPMLMRACVRLLLPR